ncbi:hypothetical protein [Suttonella ornithocola]|uniref:Chloride channel protein n=1 Tax=Suttonella ornithocola TaxID=279832 RepID=A0A380MPD0_9GAMM|nr:hypothetical protein [Suttonella ornithocola]SUO94034.1 Uncharacterised protein [Suttonella ornithocola]
MKFSGNQLLIAGGYGFLAGGIAAITLTLMQALQQLLWGYSWASHPLYVVAVIMAGGSLLAWWQYLRRQGTLADGQLSAQLQNLQQALPVKRRDMLLIALSAITAVGFGGAIVKSLIIQSIQSRYKEQLVVELSKTN